jgi:translation initiation factor 2 subunit 3
MYILRSFDVNRPGTPVEKLVGGVIGGTILQGTFRIDDEIEIVPGVPVEGKYEALHTEIVSLKAGGRSVKEAKCGGLIGIGTKLDPSLTKSDGLMGNIVGKPGTLPPVLDLVELETYLFEKVIGTKEMIKVERIKPGENLVINCGTAVTLGKVNSIRRDIVHLSLKKPICAERKTRVAISRRILGRWRLIGYGIIH